MVTWLFHRPFHKYYVKSPKYLFINSKKSSKYHQNVSRYSEKPSKYLLFLS